MPAKEQRQASATAQRLAQLQAEHAALRAKHRKLRAEHEKSQADSEKLRAQKQQMRQRLEELERRVGLNSRTSSKPRSSDGPYKAPAHRRKTRSLRGESK